MKFIKLTFLILILTFFNVHKSYAETITLLADETWNKALEPSVGSPNDGDNVDIGPLLTLTIDVDSMDDPLDANSTPNIGSITGTGTGSLFIGDNDLNVDQTIAIDSISLDTGSVNIVGGALLFEEGGTLRVEISGNVTTSGIEGGTFDISDTNSTGVFVDIDGNFSVQGDASVASSGNNDVYLKLSGSTILFGGSNGIQIGDSLAPFTGEGILYFDGSNNQTVSGIIDGVSGSEGLIDIQKTSGTITFEDVIGSVNPLRKIQVGENSTVVFEETFFTSEFQTSGGSVTLSENTASNGITSSLIIGDNTTIILDNTVTDGDTVIDATVAPAISLGTFSIQAPTTFTDGTITFISSSTDLSGEVSDITVSDYGNYIYTISSSGDGDTNLVITVEEISASQRVSNLNLSSQGVSSGEESAFTNAWTFLSADQDLDSGAYTAFNTAMNAGGATSAALSKQTSPQMDSVAGSSAVVNGISNSSMNIISSRLASVRSDTLLARYTDNLVTTDASMRLFNSGDNRKIFFKTFGSDIEGDSYDNISGYQADVYGFVLGTDTEQDNGSRLGYAYSFSDSDVSGKGTGQSVNKIDSHQLMLYGDKKINNLIFEGTTGISFNENTSTRKITASGLNRIASGEYDSSSVFVRGSLSKDINNPIGDGIMRATVGTSASKVKSDSYTETGANSLNLNVNQSDIDTLIGFAGIKFNKKIDPSLIESKLLEFRAGISYDFIGERSTTVASYTGGGSSFSINGNPVDQFGYSLGMGYLFFQDEKKKYSLNYDLESKKHSLAQTISFDLEYQF